MTDLRWDNLKKSLNMQHINLVKELVEQQKFQDAVEVIDQVDITKSLNPQFLKLCGEAYMESKRYRESRDILVKAHKMSPKSWSLIKETEFYFQLVHKETGRIVRLCKYKGGTSYA